MRIVSLADVKAHSSAYIEGLPAKGPVVITRNGKTAAVMIAPGDDEDLERLLLAHSPQFRALLDHARASLDKGEELARDEFWKTVASQSGAPAENKPPRRKRKATRHKAN